MARGLTAPAILVPLKSAFEQVHLARRFGASNLVKTPFELNRWRGGTLHLWRAEISFRSMI